MSAFFQRIRTLSCVDDSSQTASSRRTSSATLVRSSHYQPSEKPISILRSTNSSPQSEKKPEKPEKPEYPWSFSRYGHTLTPTPTNTGDLILFGGLVNNQLRNDVYSFSVQDNFAVRLLETFGDVPSPRCGHACVVVGNAVIIWGGDTRVNERDATGELDTSLYVLNVETRKWSRIYVPGASPAGRYGHTMTVIGTKLYIFGGQNGEEFTNDLIVFDIPSIRYGAKWELVEVGEDCPRPAKRTNHACVPYKDRLIMFGGTDGQFHYNDVWSFDVNSLSWTLLTCTGFIMAPREGHSATIIDNIIYIFGGRSADGSDLGDLGALRVSNRKWFMFRNMGPKPTPRSGHAMARVGSKAIVLGGMPGMPVHGVDPKDTSLLHVLQTKLIKYPKDKDRDT